MVTPPVPSPQPTVPASAPRNIGIDLARGLAVLFMIQTHALDGWISAADKLTLGYRFTRIFSNIPAPLFLLLAGVGLAMGSHSALRRGQPQASVRQNLLRRGLEVLAYGYLVSLCYSLIEGQLSLSVLL
ncbi:MAG TPA: heparan-alpha-glucosaminide N-acetyltransferase domain-containing protein, partial [Pseudomonadota bacterium]|nr:heparan-alpha-glucosaminide N-acetyltransferase domain-containing protein [Pseudomonadota bacterium]